MKSKGKDLNKAYEQLKDYVIHLPAEEFINRFYRYCLWLGECEPDELRKLPECLKRVNLVRNYRIKSK